jgi:hypothetical protein
MNCLLNNCGYSGMSLSLNQVIRANAAILWNGTVYFDLYVIKIQDNYHTCITNW